MLGIGFSDFGKIEKLNVTNNKKGNHGCLFLCQKISVLKEMNMSLVQPNKNLQG